MPREPGRRTPALDVAATYIKARYTVPVTADPLHTADALLANRARYLGGHRTRWESEDMLSTTQGGDPATWTREYIVYLSKDVSQVEAYVTVQVEAWEWWCSAKLTSSRLDGTGQVVGAVTNYGEVDSVGGQQRDGTDVTTTGPLAFGADYVVVPLGPVVVVPNVTGARQQRMLFTIDFLWAGKILEVSLFETPLRVVGA